MAMRFLERYRLFVNAVFETFEIDVYLLFAVIVMASDPLLNFGATRAHIIPKYQFIEFEATIFPTSSIASRRTFACSMDASEISALRMPAFSAVPTPDPLFLH